MKLIQKSVLATSIALGLGMISSAQAGGIYDPRSLAMGGVGVTTATSRNASFFNPAALAAAKETDDFAFNLNVAARVADPDKLSDDMDSLETSGNLLDQEISKFNSVQSPANASTLGPAVTGFNNTLKTVHNKALDASVFAGGILAIPSKKFGIGLYASGRADFGAKLNYQDATFFSALGLELTDCGNNNLAQCTAADSRLDLKKDVNGDVQLDSRLELRGSVVSEIGLSFASRFAEYGGIDIGITPKVQKVKTFNQSVSAQDSEVDMDKNTIESSGFNLDVGVTKTYGESYKAGFVIKNLINKEYALINTTEKIKLERQMRLGVSHHTNWTVVGLDVDLTTNKGLQGFSKDTQFLSIGAELDLSVIDLRIGYRHDIKGNYDGMPSVGLGLYVFGLHLDAAVAGNDKEAAASVQLGLNF